MQLTYNSTASQNYAFNYKVVPQFSVTGDAVKMINLFNSFAAKGFPIDE